MNSASSATLHVEVDGGRALISRSRTLQRTWALVQRVAPANVSVLVSGETGTGKELVARLIHKLSPRGPRELVTLDCTAIAPTLLESELFGHERGSFTGAEYQRVGVFELADGTSLFLDEISNLPLEAQAKLLRVLQERELRRIGGRRLIHTDFRLISASNACLADCVREGTFRGDLFHRLKVVQIDLPPLRERREDIPLLVGNFVSTKRVRLDRPGVTRVSHRAIDLLLSYDWPGNIRELENVIETAMLQCPGDTIDAEHLVFGDKPSTLPRPSVEEFELPFRDARRQALVHFERLYLLAQLRRYRGSIKQTAKYGGISTKHVRALMRRHGIERRDFRPALRTRLGPLAKRASGQTDDQSG
jgi:DNA-binding NtrC family response regulator